MKHLFKTLVLGSAVAAFAPFANATSISIGLQQAGANGGAITTVATDAGTGSAVYAATYGTFTFNTITAQGPPLQPQGSLSTTSIQTSATQAGTITVYITAQGLTSPTGLTNFLSSFTSNMFSGSAISVVESTLYSSTNALWTGTQMGSQTFGTIGTGTVLTPETLAGMYSETAKYVITVGSGSSSVNDTINITATAATPEPSSLILLGTGALGAAGMLRRRFTGKSNA